MRGEEIKRELQAAPPPLPNGADPKAPDVPPPHAQCPDVASKMALRGSQFPPLAVPGCGPQRCVRRGSAKWRRAAPFLLLPLLLLLLPPRSGPKMAEVPSALQNGGGRGPASHRSLPSRSPRTSPLSSRRLRAARALPLALSRCRRR